MARMSGPIGSPKIGTQRGGKIAGPSAFPAEVKSPPLAKITGGKAVASTPTKIGAKPTPVRLNSSAPKVAKGAAPRGRSSGNQGL